MLSTGVGQSRLKFFGRHTLVVDTIGIGLAAAGYLNPLLAAFIHFASELTFILNSTRLLPPKDSHQISVCVATIFSRGCDSTTGVDR
jgi:hypothetical protein